MLKTIDAAEWPETKRNIVDAGVKLMLSKGFHATSLDDICVEAGVTKGGFFHYFKNKEGIAKAALAQFTGGKAREFQQASFRKLTDPLDRVLGRLDFVQQSMTGGKGCLVGMLAQELSFTNTDLRNACHQSFERMAQDFERDLAEAKSLHKPAIDFDPKSVAAFYVTILQGSMLLSKAAASFATLNENVEHLRRYIEQLFGVARSHAGKRKTT